MLNTITQLKIGTRSSKLALKQTKLVLKKLEDLSDVMSEASICGLGQAATNPLKSVMKYFAS